MFFLPLVPLVLRPFPNTCTALGGLRGTTGLIYAYGRADSHYFWAQLGSQAQVPPAVRPGSFFPPTSILVHVDLAVDDGAFNYAPRWVFTVEWPGSPAQIPSQRRVFR